MRKFVYCFKFLLLFVVGISFISIVPEFCLASREEAALSEKYQVETEKETLKDKLSWEFAAFYGLFYPGFSRFPAPPPKEFLDTLDMSYSYNSPSFLLGVKYLLTSRLEFYAGVPFAAGIEIKDKKTGARSSKSTYKWAGGVGDIYGGASYALVTESKYRPLIITTLDVNSALSKYTSIGDGFWGITPTLSLRKFIAGPLYIKGSSGYTYRLVRKGIDPGEIIHYGGGLGFLFGNKNLELNLDRAHYAKTKIGDRTLIDSTDDLIVNIAFTTMLGKQTSTIGVYWGGLEEGFNVNRNSAGIYVDFTF